MTPSDKFCHDLQLAIESATSMVTVEIPPDLGCGDLIKHLEAVGWFYMMGEGLTVHLRSQEMLKTEYQAAYKILLERIEDSQGKARKVFNAENTRLERFMHDLSVKCSEVLTMINSGIEPGPEYRAMFSTGYIEFNREQVMPISSVETNGP